MTVAATTTRTTYISNGSATVYPYTFRILTAAQLRVVTRSALTGVETVLTYGTDYAVSGVGNATGGSVTLTSPVTLGDTLVLRRSPTIKQETSFRSQRAFFPEMHEDALDLRAMVEQYLDDALSRSLKIGETLDPANYNLVLPAPTAGQVLTGTGTGFTMSVVGSSAAVTLPGNGRTVATLSAYLANNAVFNPADFGTLGTADDTSVIAAAISNAAGKPVVLPAGTFIVRALAAPAGTRVYATPGATTLKLKTLAALDGSPIINVTGSDVILSGLGFDGNKAAQPADGFADAYDTGPNSTGRAYRSAIKFKDNGTLMSGLTVDRCTFVNTYGAGVATNNISSVRVLHSTFNLCNFEGVYIYSDFLGASFTKNHQVIGNRVTNGGSGDPTTNSSAYVFASAENYVFANNVADTVERAGVKNEYCRRAVIASNTFMNNSVLTFGGIEMQSTTTSMLVIGNKIYNWSLGIILNPQVGQFARNVTIASNLIENTTAVANGDAISVGNGSIEHLHIVGNTVRDAKRYCIGIQPNGTLRGLTITGNDCTTTGTTSGAGLVLNVTGGNWRNVLVDSNSFDCGNAALAAAGIYIITGDASTAALVQITNNVVDVGTGHNGIRENAAIVTSGLCDNNQVDGSIFLSSAGFRCGRGNKITAASGNTITADSLVRTATATPVTLTPDDSTVLTNLGVAGAVAVTTPQFPQLGQKITVKDSKGDAGTNNITITAFATHSIDTTTTYVIKANFGAVTLECIGSTAWRVVSRYNPIAAALADAAALTAPATFSAAYTKTESEALRADVLIVHDKLNSLFANLRAVGIQA